MACSVCKHPLTRFAIAPHERFDPMLMLVLVQTWLFKQIQNGQWLLRIDDIGYRDDFYKGEQFAERVREHMVWLGLAEDDLKIAYLHEYRRQCIDKITELMQSGDAFEANDGAVLMRVAPAASHADEASPLNRRMVETVTIFGNSQRPTYNFASLLADADLHVDWVVRDGRLRAVTEQQAALAHRLELPMPQVIHLPRMAGSADFSEALLSERTLRDLRLEGYSAEAIRAFYAELPYTWANLSSRACERRLLEDPVSLLLEHCLPVIQYALPQKMFRINTIAYSERRLRQLEGTLHWVAGDKAKAAFESAVAACLEQMGVTELPGSLSRVLRLYDGASGPVPELARELAFFFLAPMPHEYAAFVPEEDTLLWLARARLAGEAVGARRGFTASHLEETLEALEGEVGTANDFKAVVRVAVSAKPKSPPVGEMLAILGREESLRRLHRFIRYLEDPTSSENKDVLFEYASRHGSVQLRGYLKGCSIEVLGTLDLEHLRPDETGWTADLGNLLNQFPYRMSTIRLDAPRARLSAEHGPAR